MGRLEAFIEEAVGEINRHLPEGLSVELPDGRVFGSGSCRLVLKRKSLLHRLLLDPEMTFGEGYMKGDIVVEGDLERFILACMSYMDKGKASSYREGLFRKLIRHLGMLKLLESREVRSHYDLGDEFYKLWLDSSMTYSCAFFPDEKASLEEAQEEKRRIIYEKLQLQDGDRLLDVGCGWGSLILEAGRTCNVRAVGITVSKNQYDHVRKRIKEEGLEGKVEVHLLHYEDLPKLGEKFNKVVSVGMFEHVGVERYMNFFRVIHNVMEQGGLFLLHTIGKMYKEPPSRWIRKYIFPGGYLPSLGEIMEALKGFYFNLIDIDDWRIHYYLTLKKWRERFHRHADRVISMYSEEFFRMWDLYLVSSACSFYKGSNHLFQIILSKGVRNDYPIIKRKYLHALKYSL